MSFMRGKAGFSIMRMTGDVPELEVLLKRISTIQWRPLKDHEISLKAIVTPSDEVPDDFERPFRSLISGRALMFDLLVTERIPDKKIVDRRFRTEFDNIVKMRRRTAPGWIMDPQDKKELQEKIYEEEALKVSPRTRRTSAILHFPTKLLLVTARMGEQMDELLDVFRNTLVQDSRTMILDHLATDWDSRRNKIAPFMLTEHQTVLPKSRDSWMLELVTWIAAMSASGSWHDAGAEDRTKIAFTGMAGRTVAISGVKDTAMLSMFISESIRGGGYVKESKLALSGDHFKDGREESVLTISSTGYVSGVDPGIHTKDRLKYAYRVADGCVAVAVRVGEITARFLEMRSSASVWSNESIRLRTMLKIKAQKEIGV